MKRWRRRCAHRRAFAAAASAGALAAACGSQAAHAQSNVTLYGVLDAGLQYQTHADGQHSAVNLQNYGLIPSQFGFKGSEDLGGGLKAIFRLEQGFNLNDGTATVPGYAFFRSAWAGLEGGFGTLTAGRVFSVLFDNTVFHDPLYFASYSGQGMVVPIDVGFVNNALKYRSPEFKGLSVQALAATGGVAGNSRSGRVLELGAQLALGSTSLSGTLHQSHGAVSSSADTSALQRTIGTLAARVNLDQATLFAGIERVTGSLDPQKTVLWGGARYQFDAAAGLATGVYHTMSNTPTVGHPTLFVTSGSYALSKRTVAYANLAYSLNSAHSSQPVYEYQSIPLNGASQFGAMVGMFHLF